jgi:hypothetical protein
VTEPGIYRRGQVDYDAIDAVNFSTLKYLAESPLHYAYRLEQPVKSTPAMELGTAVHMAILEPKRFDCEYAIYRGKTRAGDKWKEFVEAHGDQEILKVDEHEAVLAMRTAAHQDKLAARYLGMGEPEVTLVWVDKPSGILCKGRLDFLSASVPDVCVDIKTTSSVAPGLFQTNYAKLHYHVQAAFYGDGYETLTGRPLYHKCVCIETKAPHDVVVYNVIGDVLEHGRATYRELLERLVQCRETKEWPGYGAGTELTLRLPAWAVRDDSNDIGDLGLELE